MAMKDLDKFNHVDLLYPSKYLKGAELMGKTVTVTIDGIDPHAELKRADNTSDFKPLLHFDGKEKMMVCCKENGQRIALMYGNDPRKWIGKKIKLHTEKVRAFGKNWDALRVVVEGEKSRENDGTLYDAETGEVASDPEPDAGANG
jgi:hypothetical protein